MRSNDNTREVGALALVTVAIFVVFAVCTAVAVGTHFGAGWGWTVAAVFAALLLVAFVHMLVSLTSMGGGDD